MNVSSQTVVRSFRAILKHVKKLPTSKDSSSEKYHSIRAMFREGSLVQDATAVQRLRLNAEAYAEMVTSVEELKHLRGLDTGDKISVRETISASAHRVGLSVPEYMTPEHESLVEKKPPAIFNY